MLENKSARIMGNKVKMIEPIFDTSVKGETLQIKNRIGNVLILNSSAVSHRNYYRPNYTFVTSYSSDIGKEKIVFEDTITLHIGKFWKYGYSCFDRAINKFKSKEINIFELFDEFKKEVEKQSFVYKLKHIGETFYLERKECILG